MKAPALVIALGKEKGEGPKSAAPQPVLDAVKATDAEALSEALSAHYAMCGG